MEKDKLNLQIVSMRRAVGSGKKLLRVQLKSEIKKIAKVLSGDVDEEKKEKLLKQIEAKKGSVTIVGELEADEISKFALQFSQNDLKKLITNPLTDLKERCMARIALKPRIQELVIQFRKENPQSNEWIGATLDLWKKRKSKTVEQKKPDNEQKSKTKPANQSPPKKKKVKKPTVAKDIVVKKKTKGVEQESSEKKKLKRNAKAKAEVKTEPMTNGTSTGKSEEKVLKKAIEKIEKKTGKQLSPKKAEVLKKKLISKGLIQKKKKVKFVL